jgi:hypothetical protein
MKKYILILFFIIFYQAEAQEFKALENQKKMYELAVEYLKQPRYSSVAGAAGFYRYLNQLNPKSEIGRMALKKSDSLISIARKSLIESLVGTWKLYETGSNSGFEKANDTLIDKVLVINENKFLFYDQNIKTKEMKLIKTEEIAFSKVLGENDFSYEFVFSDSRIWWFNIDPKNDRLRQFNTGEEKENGRTEIFCGNLEMYYTRIKN